MKRTKKLEAPMHSITQHLTVWGGNFLPHLFYSSEEVAEAKPPHFLHPLILHCRLTAKMFHTASIRLCIKLIHRQTSLQLTPFHVFLLQDSGCCLPKANCKYNARNSVLYLNTFSYTKPYGSLFAVFQRRRVLRNPDDLKADIRRVCRDVWSEMITVGMVNITACLVTDMMSLLFV